MTSRVSITRVYDAPTRTGPGLRFLVDRLWPRGVSKDHLEMDDWLKDVAPSTELRRWYGHQVDRFDEFDRRYRAELASSPAAEALELLRAAALDEGVILLTATRDVEHSGARVIESVLTDATGVDEPAERQR